MAKTSKAQEEINFQNKLAELVEAYGIVGPAVVPSQIIDLGEDLSGESPSNVYALVVATGYELQKLYIAYGSKPNVLIDAKIKNALKSFESASIEFAVLFLRTILSVLKIEIKKLDNMMSDAVRDAAEHYVLNT